MSSGVRYLPSTNSGVWLRHHAKYLRAAEALRALLEGKRSTSEEDRTRRELDDAGSLSMTMVEKLDVGRDNLPAERAQHDSSIFGRRQVQRATRSPFLAAWNPGGTPGTELSDGAKP